MDDDIAVGLNWYAEIEQCEAPAVESFSQAALEFMAYFADDVREGIDIMNDIITTKPTYGHVKQRLLELRPRRKETAPELGRKLRARLAAEYQEKLQEREEITETVAEEPWMRLPCSQRCKQIWSDRPICLQRQIHGTTSIESRRSAVIHRLKPP